MAYWYPENSSLKLTIQDDWDSESTGTFTTLNCEASTPQFDTEVVEQQLLTGQAGAAPRRLAGRRSGRIEITMPLEGFKTGYDPTAEDPGDAGVIPPWFVLIANAMGCDIENLAGASLSDKNTNFWKGSFISLAAHTADDVASATTSAVTVDAASGTGYKEGDLLVAGDGATATDYQAGFIKDQTGDVLTLLEAAANAANDNSYDVFGTATAYLSNQQPRPLTGRWVGDQTELGYRLIDMVMESARISSDAGPVPSAVMVFRFSNFIADKTIGGLSSPDSFQPIPALTGAYGGRHTLAGAVVEGAEDVSMELECDIRPIPAHHGTQGVTTMAVRKKTWRIKGTYLATTSDTIYDSAGSSANSGAHDWQSALELGTTKRWQMLTGPMVGRIVAAVVPAAQVVEPPAVTDVDGLVGYSVVLEAAAYSGDTGSTVPANTTARLALA